MIGLLLVSLIEQYCVYTFFKLQLIIHKMSKQLIEYCKRYKYEHQHEHEHEGRFLFIFLKKKFTYKNFQTLLGKEESSYR